MAIDEDNSVYVGDLSYDATKERLSRAFSLYGSIVVVKLWLSSMLNPPPPPPRSPLPVETSEPEPTPCDPPSPSLSSNSPSTAAKFQQKGNIFVGNLSLWIKKSVVLVKGHDNPEHNLGYCFIFGGPTVEDSVVRVVDLDGVEFHGRALTIRMDDGRRFCTQLEERTRWVAGDDRQEFQSKWHEERDAACRRFRKVLKTESENWQAVVSAFERIPKPSRRVFGLMVNYYGRRGLSIIAV